VNIVQRDRENHLVWNPAYEERMLDNVRYILKHQGLTDLFNAFANLHDDYDTLKRDGWIWIDERREGEISLRIATGPGDIRLQRRISNCSEAIRLVENIYRIRYRYGQVADTGALLEEFCTFVTLMISRYDAHARQILRELWRMALGEENLAQIRGARSARDLLGLAREVLERLNRIVNAKGLQKHFGRRLFGRGKDYRGWICSILFGEDEDNIAYNTPGLTRDFVRAMQYQAALTDPSNARKIARKIVETLGEGFKQSIEEYAAASPKIKYSGDKMLVNSLAKGNTAELAEFVLTKGLDVALGFLEEYAKEGIIESSKGVALESAFGQFYKADAGIQAAVEAVLGTAAEMANQAWNEWKLKTRQTYGFGGGARGGFGKRRQTFSERIGTLRTAAREEIDDYVDIIQDWADVYRRIAKMDESGDFTGVEEMSNEVAGEMLLRYQHAARRYYGNRTGQTLEEVAVYAARPLRLISEQLLPQALQAIDSDIRSKHIRFNCEPYCYCGAMLFPIR